jgi:hypothetical protein
MYTLSEFDSFSKKYLIDWEQKSTVRTGKRSRLDKAYLSEVEVSISLKRFIKYPEIQALTKEQLHPFHLQSLCDLLYGVTQLEVNFVTEQCGKLANKDLGVELTNSVKQVAIAIGTDEMYHAFAARELLADIEEYTGVIPSALQKIVDVTPSKIDQSSDKDQEPSLSASEFFKEMVTPKLERIAETTLLCILENSVVDDLFDMAKDIGDVNPVAIYNREHLQDEGRHRVFFQRLLKYIWSSILDEDRIVLGQAIAAYFKKYWTPQSLNKWVEANCKALQKLPLSELTIKNIVSQEAVSNLQRSIYEKESLKNPMQLMKIAGITQHEPTHSLFVSKGLLPESLAVV